MTGQAAAWGIVSTVKAGAADVLAFAAYHLEAGAHRIFLYLDAPCPEARPLLEAHPKIRVTDCGSGYWQQRCKTRPEKHQARQAMNATRAYRRQAKDLDWLAHIDADEFLWSAYPLADALAALPASALCARVRPVESLGGGGTAFKAWLPPGPQRSAAARRIYPRYGSQVKGGFLSHVQGKLLVRTGLGDLTLRIHNVYRGEEENPGQAELPGVDLCHFHARDWDSWLAHYRYRLEQGSYRPELAPSHPRAQGGVTMHELLRGIEAAEGLAGLRGFFDEICADTPALRARLEAEGALRIRDLRLDEIRRKHFPGFG